MVNEAIIIPAKAPDNDKLFFFKPRWAIQIGTKMVTVWNEEFREECDVDSVKFMMSEVLSSLVDPSLVEDPINVVFLVLVEPLLVEKDAEVREEWEVDSVE